MLANGYQEDLVAEAIDDWAYNSKIRLIDLREMRDNYANVVVEEFLEEANIDLDTWLEKEVNSDSRRLF